MHHVPQSLPGLSFFIWMFQSNRCVSSGSPPAAHPPAAWRDESGLFVRSLVPSFLLPLFPLVQGRVSTPWAAPAGYISCMSLVSSSISLFSCRSLSCPRVKELGAALVGWGNVAGSIQCSCRWMCLGSRVGAEIQSLFCHRLIWQPQGSIFSFPVSPFPKSEVRRTKPPDVQS